MTINNQPYQKPLSLLNKFLICFGTFIEWAEYLFFGYLAMFIYKVYLGPMEETTGLIAIYALMGGGYLMRPLGGLLFGYIGDTKGRLVALRLSMLLMGVATLLIGLLPSYEQIGIWASIGLTVSRLLQGIAIGGEFNGACISLIESNPKRGHWLSSFAMLGSVLGMVVGSSLAALVQHQSMPEYAFRVVFILGGVFSFIGLYLRSQHLSSPTNSSTLSSLSRYSLLSILFKQHKMALLKTALCSASVGALVYVGNVYFVSYLHLMNNLSKTNASLVATFGEALVLFLLPVFAYGYDKLQHPLKVFRASLVIIMLCSPFIFLLSVKNPFVAINNPYLGQCLFAILNAMLSAPVMCYVYKLYDARVRYSGISLGWGLGVACLGGFTPMLALIFQKQVDAYWGPGLLISLICGVFLISTFIQTRDR